MTGGGGAVRVWDVEHKECLRRWEVGPGAFERFELNEPGTQWVAKQGRRTTVWDLGSGVELDRRETPVKPGAMVSFEGAKGNLVTYDADNRAWLWHTNGSRTDLRPFGRLPPLDER